MSGSRNSLRALERTSLSALLTGGFALCEWQVAARAVVYTAPAEGRKLVAFRQCRALVESGGYTVFAPANLPFRTVPNPGRRPLLVLTVAAKDLNNGFQERQSEAATIEFGRIAADKRSSRGTSFRIARIGIGQRRWVDCRLTAWRCLIPNPEEADSRRGFPNC